jgi:hypothetical protein
MAGPAVGIWFLRFRKYQQKYHHFVGLPGDRLIQHWTTKNPQSQWMCGF